MNEELKKYDPHGKIIEIPYSPILLREHQPLLTSMYVDENRILFARTGPENSVVIHEITQKEAKITPVPIMKNASKILISPEGSIILFGVLKGSFDYDLKVHGMKKMDAMPKGIVAIPKERNTPTVIHKGVDSMGYSNKGFWTYHRDLYKESDQQSILQNFTKGISRQIISVYNWDTSTQVYDVSDAKNHTSLLQAVDGDFYRPCLYSTGSDNLPAGLRILSNPYASPEQ